MWCLLFGSGRGATGAGASGRGGYKRNNLIMAMFARDIQNILNKYANIANTCSLLRLCKYSTISDSHGSNIDEKNQITKGDTNVEEPASASPGQKLGGFARAFEKYTAPSEAPASPKKEDESFLSLLRKSKFIDCLCERSKSETKTQRHGVIDSIFRIRTRHDFVGSRCHSSRTHFITRINKKSDVNFCICPSSSIKCFFTS
ncbi:hypothetical protein B566_EDAN001373 [Ephemera danica]|nr:hypothetical protein B566_EDAN001373 [Ephemera danica]